MRNEKQTQPNNRNSMLRAGKLLLITGIALMFSIGAFAQTEIPPSNDLTEVDAPIDGGVSLLVAAGVAYGAKRWKDARKNKEEVNEQL